MIAEKIKDVGKEENELKNIVLITLDILFYFF